MLIVELAETGGDVGIEVVAGGEDEEGKHVAAQFVQPVHVWQVEQLEEQVEQFGGCEVVV